MAAYADALARIEARPLAWVVTGAAGFIGSNLTEALLAAGQRVVGLDNFATGLPANLDSIRAAVGPEAWARFRFVEGDITDLATCQRAFDGADAVLHQAALGSVPRSIADPLTSHASNVNGFLNVLIAAKEAGIGRFVYASSSSVYGDHPALPKVEANVGMPLSPYAATKRADEIYAHAFGQVYPIKPIGLRYFNVYGRRQRPDGPYAAVIPRWVGELLVGARPTIYGDGETSRDFCYVANVVQANLLAALTDDEAARGEVYNVAVGGRTTLNEVLAAIREELGRDRPAIRDVEPVYAPFRPGDVRHSQADVSKAERLLGYAPTHDFQAGLREALAWYQGQAQGV
jgi:UDP-N-acetylglucosamine 4-epimerase